MTSPVLGIDIAKRRFDVALLFEVDTKPRHKSFDNGSAGFSALAAWLKKQGVGKLHTCLEATGRYGEALASFLYDDGHRVSVVNPAQIRDYAKSQLRRNKTDKLDAAIIARFCAKEDPRAWQPLPSERRELQALARRLEALDKMRQQERNRLEDEGEESLIKDTLEEHIIFLDRQIEALKHQIQEHIAKHAELKAQRTLLTSIPGIAELTAAKILAALPKLADYKSARQAVAQVGLNPQKNESGDSVRGKTSLSKTGDASLRKALYMPAVSAKTHNPLIRDLAERLKARGKCDMEIVGAAMRKLVHLAYGVIKTGKPFDPLHHQKQLAAS